MSKEEHLPRDADILDDLKRSAAKPDSRLGTRGRTTGRAGPDKSVAYSRNVPASEATERRRRTHP